MQVSESSKRAVADAAEVVLVLKVLLYAAARIE
jgi:hypothetical protein